MSAPTFSWLRDSKKNKPTKKDIMTEWADSRQDLIVYLEKLSGTHPYPEEHIKITPESINYLNELCTDYMSMGHFRAFEHLASEYNKVNPGQGIDGEYLEILTAFTQRTLDICDDLSNTTPEKMPKKLSELYQSLDIRFEVEDQMKLLYLSNVLNQKQAPNTPRPRL